MPITFPQTTGTLPRDAWDGQIQVVPTCSLVDNLALAATITNAARATTTATITAVAHGFKVGQKVTIALLTGPTGFAALNGTYLITATATADTFTYTTTTSGTVTTGAATGTATAYNLSPMPTATTELTFVFPAKSFQLVVIPTAATDATMSYISGGGLGGTFPLFQNVANVICGVEGDTVYVQRTTTTPIAFIFSCGK